MSVSQEFIECSNMFDEISKSLVLTVVISYRNIWWSKCHLERHSFEHMPSSVAEQSSALGPITPYKPSPFCEGLACYVWWFHLKQFECTDTISGVQSFMPMQPVDLVWGCGKPLQSFASTRWVIKPICCYASNSVSALRQNWLFGPTFLASGGMELTPKTALFIDGGNVR